ncbi:TRAP transporter small permease [Thalassococcus sp. S3]|uniref:TRAP transporter small permease n=1 Tax=Thalassococcus sp. S3 TaxID=2017482 RepID=UPI0010243E92|nr:TRAP transporter small permease subunit [Thalassococcus sp. S3]QBF32585.1 hypothetical protein CFI11_15365 [Thalassococcus sp. S3]
MSRSVGGDKLARLRSFVSRGLLVAVTLALAMLILLEVYQITLRYVLAQSLPWGRDVAGLLLFTLAWLGLPLLWLERSHLNVLLFRMSAARARAWDRGLDAVACVAAIALSGYIWQAMESFRFIDMPTLGVSAEIRFYPLFAGSILFALAAALNLTERRAS